MELRVAWSWLWSLLVPVRGGHRSGWFLVVVIYVGIRQTSIDSRLPRVLRWGVVLLNSVHPEAGLHLERLLSSASVSFTTAIHLYLVPSSKGQETKRPLQVCWQWDGI